MIQVVLNLDWLLNFLKLQWASPELLTTCFQSYGDCTEAYTLQSYDYISKHLAASWSLQPFAVSHSYVTVICIVLPAFCHLLLVFGHKKCPFGKMDLCNDYLMKVIKKNCHKFKSSPECLSVYPQRLTTVIPGSITIINWGLSVMTTMLGQRKVDRKYLTGKKIAFFTV